MKKKNLKYLLFIICLCIFNMDNVFAFNARVGTTTSHSTGESQGYYDIAIFYNGAEYKQAGYCANEGLNLPNYYDKDTGLPEPMNYNCQVINDPEIYKILTSGGSHGDKQRNLWNYIQNGTTSTSPNGTLLTRIGESGHTITYSINSAIDPTKLSITCGTGCASTSINGMILIVTLQENACSFTINVTYSGPTIDLGTTTTGGKVLHCTRNSNTEQDVYMPMDDKTGNTDQKNLTFSDSLNWCDNIPNKCNGHTQIEIPEYCDNPNEEDQITITAPTDVINDVIGCEDDAGKTYQSHQLANNPYCSVWCKEDYRMELPGAQYTTSGRYFELKDTKVHVERTCYAGNGTKETDKTDGINIDQFIKDVIAQQKLIVQRYNAYKRIEREIELINAKTEPTATYQSKKSDCTDGNMYNYFEVTEDKYQGYEIEKCDEKTGKCIVRKREFSTTAYWWGTKITESKETTNTDGTKTCTQTTASNPKPVLNKDAALNNLKDAVNGLGTINEHMENCYNWTNDLCYGPDVEFNYNEQYSTDINYERDGENPTSIDGKDATYGVGEKIDNQYSAESRASLETIDYLFCDKDGCDNLNHEGVGYNNTANDISTLEKKYYYRKIKTEGDATYKNKQSFISNYPHGTIDKAPEDSEKLPPNYEYLGAIFPVALKTPIGVYKWTLNFLNVGQYNDFNGCSDAALGRLNDVAKVVHNNNLSTDIGYVCVYVVDCPECDYECVCPDNLPDGYTCEKLGKYNCVITEPECPECEVRCINCIFDGDDTIYYRTISLNYDTDDLNPNNRELGPNWDKDTNEKAKDTLKEMEKGEKAYEQAEYTFVITPTHMKAIRDYNRDTGTYVAEDLIYGEVDGVSNIAGYSKFLRGDSTQYSDSAFNRTFFKSAKLNSKWELWTSGIKDAVVPVNSNIGPAWK